VFQPVLPRIRSPGATAGERRLSRYKKAAINLRTPRRYRDGDGHSEERQLLEMRRFIAAFAGF